MSGSDTWGIDGTSFLLLYAALGVATAVAIWLVRRRLLNASAGVRGTPELDAYELAMLNGGPQLAVTTVAAKLHGEGALGSQAGSQVIVAKARPADATDLEHEVYGEIERTDGMSADMLRRRVEDSAGIRAMATRLTGAGLLLDDGRRSMVRSLWLLALPLLALGAARSYAGYENGKSIGFIVIATIAVGTVTLGYAKKRPWATARGTELLDAQRGRLPNLERTAIGPQIPLGVALFGTGVLWLAAPEIATAWSVPRDMGSVAGSGSGGSGSGSGGGSSCGGGGCGGGCGG